MSRHDGRRGAWGHVANLTAGSGIFVGRFMKASIALAALGVVAWLVGAVANSAISDDNGANIGAAGLELVGMALFLVGVALTVIAFAGKQLSRKR